MAGQALTIITQMHIQIVQLNDKFNSCLKFQVTGVLSLTLILPFKSMFHCESSIRVLLIALLEYI